MKIGIISDTHGVVKNMDKAIHYLKECDLIIHAGDNVDDAEYIHYATDVDVKAVKGNCDLIAKFSDEYELIFTVKDKRFLLCHGHYYDVKYGVESLLRVAKHKNIDIVVFGHSHIPVYEEIDEVIFINPGSLSYPRGNSKKQFGILTIDDKISYKTINI